MKTVYATRPRRESSPALSVSKPQPFLPVSAPGFPTDLLPPRITAALLEALRGETGMVEEIRLRAGRRASLTVGGRNIMTEAILTEPELSALLTHNQNNSE